MRYLGVALIIILATTSSRAITTNNGVHETTDNVSAANWSTGWTGTGVDGWSYVGDLGGQGTGGGVYLGNGWVITAAHVGAGSGTYVLDGVSYTVNTSTEHTIGTADLMMFQISSASGLPKLASLTLASSAPTSSTPMVMIGYGGGTGGTISTDSKTGVNGFNVNGSTAGVESWGVSYLSVADVATAFGPYTSTDYRTTFTAATNPLRPSAIVQGGDSGGGVFIYDTATKKWELSGILELLYTASGGQSLSVDSGDQSGIIDLSQYAAQIDAIEVTNPSATPEPGATALFGLGLMGGACALRRRGLFAAA
jgi:hypothetical protein